jgi:N-acyl homoserine lactone hydrolase
MNLPPIEITPLSTGSVSIKESMHRGQGTGMRRRSAIFRPGPWTGSLPIHAWLIHHSAGAILVDSGEVATARDAPFARFTVTREDEIDRALAAHGVEPGDLRLILLTHVHGDHADGAARLPDVPVVVSEPELKLIQSLPARLTRTVIRQPLPPGFAPTAAAYDGPGIGAFSSSHLVTEDGRVRLVPAPGHTPGHAAVLVDQGDHHVLLAGDAAYDVAQLVDLHVDGVSPNDAVARRTMETILAHARLQPTVVLPTHDPGSAARLAAAEPLALTG